MRSIQWRGRLARLAGVLAASGFIGLATAQQSRAQDADIGAQAAEDHAALGTVDFDVSCSPDVIERFDRALALLHHMQYVESRAAFEQIAEADESCGMARWGIAMTLFQPLWPSRPGPDELRRGAAEIEAARTIGIGTDRETALVDAAAAFFAEPESADWWTRIRRWSDAMEVAFAAHPDDVETAALYALSQLAIGPVTDDRMAHNARAAEVLLEIHDREPSHPGAVHYTIHANDVDSRANESGTVVRSYSEIAPSTPHALHMPSHIYVRLGQWPEVVEWNRRSAAAALSFPAGEAVSHHYLHALDYQVYAYLQRAEDDRALALVNRTKQEDAYQATFISAFHLATIPARYAVERRAWEEAGLIEPRAPESVDWDKFRWAEAISWFARGLGAVHTGQLDAAANAERHMDELRDAATAADEQAFAEYIEIDRLILAARLALAGGDENAAVRLASDAVELEASTQKHPVTPGALYPAQEALGDLLMELDRPAEALEAYEGSLDTWPGRFNSLAGAARAAVAVGRDGDAAAYYGELLAVTAGDVADRPALREARAFAKR